VFGLLGPNGAGKSTLVKIMMTVIRPTKAAGTMLGHPIGHKPTLARVGYLPEHHRFPRYLTGRQALDFYAALAKVDRTSRKRRATELLATVGMTDWANKKISSYSKGMMQRIGLAQALMNDPHLIVLDEPTDGVDPVGRREIRDVLLQLKKQGKTIFLNSHLLSELEMVCDRVSILVQGQVAVQGTLEELTRDSQRYEITIQGSPPDWVNGRADVRAEAIGDRMTKIVLRSAEPADVQPLIDRLRVEQRTIHSVKPVRENLEDLFMRAVIDPATGKARPPGAGRDQP
jgi:ABC-2 type transport system ATP-binding protein